MTKQEIYHCLNHKFPISGDEQSEDEASESEASSESQSESSDEEEVTQKRSSQTKQVFDSDSDSESQVNGFTNTKPPQYKVCSSPLRASTVYCLVDEVLRHGEIVPDKEKKLTLQF